MQKRFKIFIISLIVGSLYGIYYLGIPAIVNLSAQKVNIQQLVQSRTGFNIDYSNAKLKTGIFPSLVFQAESFTVIGKDTTPLAITNPYLKIKILPLLLRKLEISEFSADSVDIILGIDEKFRIKLGQYEIPSDLLVPFVISKATVSVDKFSLNLKDDIFGKNITLLGNSPFGATYKSNKYVNIFVDTQLQSVNSSSLFLDAYIKLPLNKIDTQKVRIKSRIKDLNLGDFSSFVTAFSGGKVKKLTGIINGEADTLENNDGKQILSVLTLDDFGIYNNDKFKSMVAKNRLNISADISPVDNALKINDFKINGNDIDLNINGKIQKVNSSRPYFDINTAINKSRVEAFIPLLPGEENLSPDINLYKLKQNPLYGDIVGNLHILGDNLTPDIIGNVLISNGYLIKPIPNTYGTTVKLSFNKNVLDLDVHVPTDANQYVDVQGPIQLYGAKNADLQISSSDSVNLATAQFVLNPLHEILKFVVGPVPVMNIKGYGGVDLRVYGNKAKPHAFGMFKFRNGTVSFNDIRNMVITNASGELTFNDIDTKFRTDVGLLNGKPVNVEGTCDLYGNLDFNVVAQKQDLGDFVKILSASPLLGEYSKLVNSLTYARGTSSLTMNLKGKVPDPNYIVIGENIFAKGFVSLESNTISLKDLPAKLNNVRGKIEFDNEDTTLDLIGNLNSSPIKISGKTKKTLADLKFSSENFVLGNVFATVAENLNLPYQNDLKQIKTSFVGHYNGSIESVVPQKLSLNGKIFKFAGTDLSVGNSTFELLNGNFKLSNLQGNIKQNPYFINLYIKNLFDVKPNINGQVNLQNFDLSMAESFRQMLPIGLGSVISDIGHLQGKINLTSKIVNNKVRAYTELDGVSFEYIPQKLRLLIVGGSALLDGSSLNLNKFNTKLGGMPVFLNGKITNIFKKPNLDIYVNAKPSQDFVDRFFNNTQVYPLKLKGDIGLTSSIKGNKDFLSVNSVINIDENSSIYYMGASVGDSEYPVKIVADADLTGTGINLKNFKYDKIITSQNNKPYPTGQLEASGGVNYLKNNIIAFDNFKVKTLAPTDAKVFNLIFRKPIMKQGIFTSDLVLNGTSLKPEVLGDLEVTSVDIPFVNSTINDIKIKFAPDKIFVNSTGDILSNRMQLFAEIKNKFSEPYIVENMKLVFDSLNIDELMNILRDFEVESVQSQSVLGANAMDTVDLSKFLIENAIVLADRINVKNIAATNFKSRYSFDEKMMLNVKDYEFDVAQGKVSGNAYYNLLTHAVGLNMHMIDANAQVMSEALFDLKGQIYGLLTGDVNLMCNAKSQEKCMQTLSGDAFFIVKDGKMPKLGSLEYLLKAGNLISGGFSGLSINGIIDLITPLKTGEFASISGDAHISNGIAQKINVYSDGKDLNMYMTGSYNISTAIAQMKIYGSLTNNVTNLFSKIRSVSLNTLFHSIPWVNSSDETEIFHNEISKIPTTKNQSNVHKIFVVDINGDINGSNYVKSFKWVK